MTAVRKSSLCAVVIGRLIRWYNEEWLHSALGFLRPVDYCRGNPEEMYAVRRRKLAEARRRRREKNLPLRLPLAVRPADGKRCPD